ncbi:hypothetical protein BIU99_17150 [Plantibacter sp. MMLR14_011]|nr:hypothetical protein BIU99_17150 [Plantibacter sp. MMLR14_011]
MPLTGDGASEAGRAFLLAEYGFDDALDEAIRVGTPKVGAAPESGTNGRDRSGAGTRRVV